MKIRHNPDCMTILFLCLTQYKLLKKGNIQIVPLHIVILMCVLRHSVLLYLFKPCRRYKSVHLFSQLYCKPKPRILFFLGTSQMTNIFFCMYDKTQTLNLSDVSQVLKI